MAQQETREEPPPNYEVGDEVRIISNQHKGIIFNISSDGEFSISRYAPHPPQDVKADDLEV